MGKIEVGDLVILNPRGSDRLRVPDDDEEFHTGIVVGVREEELVHQRDVHVCVTVEGNTNDDGSANGNATLRKVRTLLSFRAHRKIPRRSRRKSVRWVARRGRLLWTCLILLP